MQRLILPVTAAGLVILAVGGVSFGLLVQPGEQAEPAAQAQPATTTGAKPGAQLTTQPETKAGQPEAKADDPNEFIRFGVATPPAKAKGAIRLAAYNTENLFDAVDDPSLSGRNEDIDDAKPESQLKGLAHTITELDADVLALEEVESEAVAKWFRDTYIPDDGYKYLASIDAGDERAIEQVVLSRYPITDVTNWPGRLLGGTHPEKWGSGENWHAGEPITFHRSPLRVTVEVPGGDGDKPYDLTLYVIHAKSGGPGEYWRLAEAKGLVDILKHDTTPGQNIAILGDFNALLSDGSMQTIVGAGFSDALADVYKPGPKFTTHESGRRIDLILVNAALKSELVPGSGFVLGTPALPEGMDWRQEWRPEGYASDHYPVAVDLVPHDVQVGEHAASAGAPASAG